MPRHDLRPLYQLKAVTTGSESLLDDRRQVMAEAFECPVVDAYGAAEHVCNISRWAAGPHRICMELNIAKLDIIDDCEDGAKTDAGDRLAELFDALDMV